MYFGPLPTAEAAGAILAHAQAVAGLRMKKGRVLSTGDVEALLAAGVDSVIAARLEAGDMAEDEAAEAIAGTLAGAAVRRQAAFTGRANLYAEADGVLCLDTGRIDALNRIDEAITVATLPPHHRVREGQMLATIKIIPFAAPRAAVETALAIAGEATPLVSVSALRPRNAALIMTRLETTKASVLDKTREVLAARLTELSSRIGHEARCAHEAEAIGSEIEAALAAGANPVLIFGASAITDRRDEIPAGIEAAGGTVDHFGMPVDPGNLLLLGHKGDVPIIGLPGCARSPKLNGFDWVLERLVAGVPVTADDIKAMGTGGLLMEIASRPQPRAGSQANEPARAPRIAALVLAAGQSRRMGRRNKLLAEIDGVPMVARAVDSALASEARSVVVVTGHEPDEVRACLADRSVRFAHSPDYAEGLSQSLRAGLDALGEDIDGVVVLLGDMPRVGPAHIDKLIAAFNPLEGRAICVPTRAGKRGNPVLFARHLFEDMRTVAGDVGARHLIGQHEDELVEVEMGGDDDAIFIDVDTPEALTEITSRST